VNGEALPHWGASAPNNKIAPNAFMKGDELEKKFGKKHGS
jgi:hypothetical protein